MRDERSRRAKRADDSAAGRARGATVTPFRAPSANPPPSSARVRVERSQAEQRRDNLPAQLTSFVGRERELAEVERLLGTARLLTLTGAPGIGKTRLALRVAGELVAAYPDGAWLAELAALADPALVPQVVATVLGVREQPDRPLPATLADALRSRRALLVLDNCEHLIQSCATLADTLLRACPDLRILATSREPLAIAGEVIWRVPSLALPDPQVAAPFEALLGSEAIRLFVERARAARPTFDLTTQNAHAVADVCRRLDGIPLALELAAAWVKALSVEQLARRLDDQFRLLTGGSRVALPRQRTLRALVDWSHDLLPEPERALLRRLSVFAGGWSLEAAEAVCSGEGTREDQVLELLSQLVDKSLVLAEEQGGAARYRLLGTIRQHGSEKLREAGEEAALRTCHLKWFTALAEHAELPLRGPDQVAWLERLEQEHDDLRAALSWWFEHGESEFGLRLVAALGHFWEVHGHLSEGQRWLEQALSRAAGGPAAVRLKSLSAAGTLAYLRNDHDLAATRHEESLALARELDDRSGIAAALHNLGRVALYRRDRERAAGLLEQSLALRRALGDKRGIAMSLNSLGVLARGRGDYLVARSLYEESLALFRELGDEWGRALLLNNLARVTRDVGDWQSTATLCRDSLDLFRKLGDRHGIAWVLSNLGVVARVHGDWERAARLFGAVEALRESVGSSSLSASPDERATYEAAVVATRTKLGEDAFAATSGLGRAMPLGELIELARSNAEPPAVAPAALAPDRRGAGSTSSQTVPLTPREREVAALIARGLSNRQIAERLVIGEWTVETHVRHILRKLEFRSRAQVAAWVVDRGLLTPASG